MPSKLFDMRRKLLRKRAEILRVREKKFNQFIERIKEEFGDDLTVVLIGSRASGEARSHSDFDIIIIHRKVNEDELLGRIMGLKPKTLPVDVIILKEEDLKDKIVQQMLKSSKILHDGLDIRNTLIF